MRGIEDAKFCGTCGKPLVEVRHGYAVGFDVETGERRPDYEWVSRDCPVDHMGQHWRQHGGDDGTPPLWYAL